MTRKRTRALVIGGSIGGLAAGIALRATGADVLVVERRHTLIDEGAGLGVDTSILNRISALADSAPDTPLPTTTTLWRRVTEVDAAGSAIAQSAEHLPLKHAAWAGLWSHLRALYDGPYVHDTVRDVAVTANRAHVTFDRQGGQRFDLVIVADGYHSRFRELVDPVSPQPSFAGYILWRGLLAAGILDTEIEQLIDNTMHLATTDPDHLVAYPIPGTEPDDPSRLNWGWYTPATTDDLNGWFRQPDGHIDPRSITAVQLDPAIAHRVAEAAQRRWPEPFRTIIEHTVEHQQLFAAGIFEYRPTRLTHGPIALLGDAAHTASPITGAGAKHAILDAITLAEALRHNPTPPDALAAYNQQRLRAVQGLVDQGHHWGRRFQAG